MKSSGPSEAEARAKREPAALTRGKLFHHRLQESWKARHGGIGEARIEIELVRYLGRRGRPDIQVDIATPSSADSHQELFVAVLEAKSRDFARLSRISIRRLVARDRRQVLRYVDQLFAGLSAEVGSSLVSIARSIIYETGPRSPDDRAAIESYLDEAGVGVIWVDETVEEAKQRLTTPSAEGQTG